MTTVRRRGSVAQHTDTLQSAARIFSAITAESIAQVGEGVTLPQLRVLVLASQPGHLNATGVAEALGVHLSSASRICDRLVQAGLLARRDLPQDRRNVELTLTPTGERLLASVNDHRRDVFTRILRRMDASARAALAEALSGFVAAAEEYGGRSSVTP
jgi:DNA-binding MarR family transcriptional regulator